MFYGDNTEFKGDFRKGDTTLGVWGRVFLSAHPGEKVEIRGGVFVNELYGSDNSFELVRPVIALVIGTETNRFVAGTLETGRRAEGAGPDRTTLHGLLPMLQAETLTFSQPYQNGFQWILNNDRVRNDFWINWRTLALANRREVIDGGTAGRVHIGGPLWLGFQAHEAHHGGQVAQGDPVGDSLVAAVGPVIDSKIQPLDHVSFEFYGLGSDYNPDRGDSSRKIEGTGVFLRLRAEKAGWGGHVIYWRGTRYRKEDGDPNYFSWAADHRTIAGGQDYEEAGLTRLFSVIPGVQLETSARLHRTTLLEQARSTTAETPPGLVVVGPNEPYSAGEIGRALDAPVLATIARDQAAAAHLSDGRPRPRRFEQSALARSMAEAAASFATALQRNAERVRI